VAGNKFKDSWNHVSQNKLNNRSTMILCWS